MVSDSLTYVYSSHEWQQARATTSFGRDYRNAASGHKYTSKRGNYCSVRERGDSFLSGHAAQQIAIIYCCKTVAATKTASETAISQCKPLAGCTALQT